MNSPKDTMKNDQTIPEPTPGQVSEFLTVIQDAFIFQAIHGIGTQPNPAVIQTFSWLKQKFNVN